MPPSYTYPERSLYSGNMHIVPATPLMPVPTYPLLPTPVYAAVISLPGPVLVLLIGGGIPLFPSLSPIPLASPSPPPPPPFWHWMENRMTHWLFPLYYEFLPLPLPFL